MKDDAVFCQDKNLQKNVYDIGKGFAKVPSST